MTIIYPIKLTMKEVAIIEAIVILPIEHSPSINELSDYLAPHQFPDGLKLFLKNCDAWEFTSVKSMGAEDLGNHQKVKVVITVSKRLPMQCEWDVELELCPRCSKNYLDSPIHRNALSRRDNQTYICENCGIEEALYDAGFADEATIKRDMDFQKKLDRGPKDG